MEIVGKLLDLVNNPVVKYLLTLIGGLLLTKLPDFQKKAVPWVTGLAGLILSVLKAMFPDVPGMEVHNAVMTASVVAVPVSFLGDVGKSLVTDWLVPWLCAIGTHSGVKNTVQLGQQKKSA